MYAFIQKWNTTIKNEDNSVEGYIRNPEMFTYVHVFL